MVITKFKIFEDRGDGVEDEDDMPTYVPTKKNSDGSITYEKPTIPKDYVLGLPSGEVVLLNGLNELKALLDDSACDYTYSFKDNVINCYCAPDSSIQKIKEFIKYLRDTSNKSTDVHEKIAKDYGHMMGEVTGRNSVVAYVKKTDQIAFTGKDSVDFYYVVIPDLMINGNFYNRIVNDMLAVCKDMRSKYKGSFFTFTDRLHEKNATYYQ